eukprot:888248-Pelagomonas_calceolata.AAC.2
MKHALIKSGLSATEWEGGSSSMAHERKAEHAFMTIGQIKWNACISGHLRASCAQCQPSKAASEPSILLYDTSWFPQNICARTR